MINARDRWDLGFPHINPLWFVNNNVSFNSTNSIILYVTHLCQFSFAQVDPFIFLKDDVKFRPTAVISKPLILWTVLVNDTRNHRLIKSLLWQCYPWLQLVCTWEHISCYQNQLGTWHFVISLYANVITCRLLVCFLAFLDKATCQIKSMIMWHVNQWNTRGISLCKYFKDERGDWWTREILNCLILAEE